MTIKVKLNKYGYYSVCKLPTQRLIENYCSIKYYQNTKDSYSKCYNDGELKYIYNKIEQKLLIIEKRANKKQM